MNSSLVYFLLWFHVTDRLSLQPVNFSVYVMDHHIVFNQKKISTTLVVSLWDTFWGKLSQLNENKDKLTFAKSNSCKLQANASTFFS